MGIAGVTARTLGVAGEPQSNPKTFTHAGISSVRRSNTVANATICAMEMRSSRYRLAASGWRRYATTFANCLSVIGLAAADMAISSK